MDTPDALEDKSDDRILQFVAERERAGEPPPSLKEVADALGGRSVSTAQYHLKSLLQSGLLSRTAHRARSLHLTPTGWVRVSAASGPLGGPLAEPPDPEILDRLQPWLHANRFKAGQILWLRGDPSEAGMLVRVERGQIQAWRDLPEGREMTLYLFGPGDVFGFLPFVDGGPYPASARALEDTEASVLTRADLKSILKQSPEFGVDLLTQLGRRLRDAFASIERLSSPSSFVRVASGLCDLVRQGSGAQVIALPTTARSFASTLGIRPESYARAISQLEAQEILRRLGPRSYQILDIDGLHRLAGCTKYEDNQ